MLSIILLALFFLTLALAVTLAGRTTTSERLSSPDRLPAGTDTGAAATAGLSPAAPGYYRSHSAAYWAWQFRRRTEQLLQLRHQLRHRWQPTVSYALRLASAVSGVSYYELRSVAWCESRHSPFAQNGQYKGLFQLGWSPFGFSPFDPVANALSAAMTVSREGWRQWTCKP